MASTRYKIEQSVLADMRDTMHHRGPDDSGSYLSNDGQVGLAQRRLAIIDLSPRGHQPMTDATGTVWITYNGEIYNYKEIREKLESLGHQFQSASDTEVILEAYRAWGKDCLKYFNGMFAFGLYDTINQQIFLARDRAGEKPLFYWHVTGKLVFASELKAILADPSFPRQLDPKSLEYYLAYGYVPGALCIFKDVHKLPPAHAALYNLRTGDLQTWAYWQIPPPDSDLSISADELENELESLLQDSVRQKLVADVPVGVLLSGGIDSSLVVAMAARVSPNPVRTFTISFPGHGSYDEGPYAKIVAQHFATEHTELIAEPATVDLLPELARQYDEPMADSSMVPTYMVSRLVRQHATVALGGDGGDELFGGYNHYSLIQKQEKLRQFIPEVLRQAVGTVAAEKLPSGLKGRNYLIGFTSDLAHSIAHVNMYFDASTRRNLLVSYDGSERGMSPEVYKATLCDSNYSPLQQATRVDFQTTMVDAYLVKVDRASMLASLEVRSPFLDYRIIEMAFSRVPDSLRATREERKILPRRLAARLLPRDLDLKRKQGFSMPLQTWFKGKWGEFIEEVLNEADPTIFNKAGIKSLLEGQRRGFSNTNRLFALTMFELWRREYQVKGGSV